MYKAYKFIVYSNELLKGIIGKNFGCSMIIFNKG